MDELKTMLGFDDRPEHELAWKLTVFLLSATVGLMVGAQVWP